MKAPLPPSEVERLASLRALVLLDTNSERVFDDTVPLAAHICESPVALMSLVDSDRQWFKAKVGLTACETDRDSSFGAHIAVVDSQGVIVAVNEAWRRFARANVSDPAGGLGVGTDYLAVCRRATTRGEDSVQEILEGIEAVIRGDRGDFGAEYPCHGPNERRWFYMRVRPLPKAIRRPSACATAMGTTRGSWRRPRSNETHPARRSGCSVATSTSRISSRSKKSSTACPLAYRCAGFWHARAERTGSHPSDPKPTDRHGSPATHHARYRTARP